MGKLLGVLAALSLVGRLSASPALQVFNLSNYHNVQYLLSVSIGTPPQNFQLMLETFSSVTTTQWVWVPSTACEVALDTQVFDPTVSRTYTNTHEIVNLNYYGSGCSGNVSTDTLRLNTSNSFVELHSASFLLVGFESANMQFLQGDGFLVLSTQGLGLTATPPSVLAEAVQQQQVAASIFSIYLGDNHFGYDETDPRSVLILGGSLPRKYASSSLVYLPVVLDELWAVSLDAVRVGSIAMPQATSRIASFDVGMDVIIAYEDDYTWIEAAIAAFGSCRLGVGGSLTMCDCLANYAVSDYPTLRLQLGTYVTSLSPQQYFGVVMSPQQGNFCLLMIMPSNSQTWTLGSPFMRAYYMEFDSVSRRVGLAPAVTSSVQSDNSSMVVWGSIMLTLMAIGLGYVIFKAFQTRRRTVRERLLPAERPRN